MNWSDLPLNPTPRILRQFAAAWFLVFLAAALRQAFARHHPIAGWVLGAVSLAGILGLVKPPAVRWLFVGATIVAFPIGWVVSHLMLAVMFYLVLTPIALFFRFRGRDELHLRRNPAQTSQWHARGDPPEAGRYLKQY